MADAETKEAKPSVIMEFRKKLRNHKELKATVTEGLKATQAKVRALAVKAAFKLKDHSFVKQNVLPLIKTDKSKKVLRAISDKITRRELYKKVKAMRVVKKLAPKKETAAAPAEGADAAGAKAEKA